MLEVIEGGGSVEQNVIYSDGNEVKLTRWKMGDTSNKQTLQALIYDSKDRFLSKVEFNHTSDKYP